LGKYAGNYGISIPNITDEDLRNTIVRDVKIYFRQRDIIVRIYSSGTTVRIYVKPYDTGKNISDDI
jgi:hypothetical protein